MPTFTIEDEDDNKKYNTNYATDYGGGSEARRDSDDNRQRTSSFLDRLHLPHPHLPHMPKIDSNAHFDLDEFHGTSPSMEEYEKEEADLDKNGDNPTVVPVFINLNQKGTDSEKGAQNGVHRLVSSDSKLDLDPERKERWRSIWLATIILFLISVQFSIYFSSLWPYLQILDKNATESFFGLVVAGYSLGQMIASPIFAKWSNTIKSVRIPIACGICLTLCGNFIYVFTEAFPEDERKWILLGTRFLMGLAAGVTGIIRAYVATSSKIHERHRAIAQTTAAQSLGMTAGPIIQVCFYPIGYPAIQKGAFYLNEYTGPAYISILACIVLLVLLIFFFKEYYSGIVVRVQHDMSTVVPNFNRFAAFLCIWFWFTMFFCVTNIETIESPYTMAIYDWTAENAVFYNGLILGCSGFLSFSAYFIYAMYGKRFIRERLFITVGLIMLFSFYVITYPWPFYTKKLDYKYSGFTSDALSNYTGTFPPNWTSPMPTTNDPSATTLKVSNITAEAVGCDDDFGWCTYTPWVPPEVYFCAYPLISIGFPTINVALSTLYSKILGPRRQNIMQSLMIMAGSLARLIGPIFIAYCIRDDFFRLLHLFAFVLFFLAPFFNCMVLVLDGELLRSQLDQVLCVASFSSNGWFHWI